MAQRGGLPPTAPTFLQRVQRDLASKDDGVLTAIVREITEVSRADTPALESEEYSALAIVLREGWGEVCSFDSDRIKAYTALVAHHRISADECRKALPMATEYYFTNERSVHSAHLDLFVAMLHEVSWEPAVIDLLIQTVRNLGLQRYIAGSDIVPFLQAVHEKYPSAANGWASAALSFASRWGYSPSSSCFVGGSLFSKYLCTTTTPSDDGLLDMAWSKMDFVELCKGVGALPAAIRKIQPLSCDGWDDTVRAQALRRLLLCPKDLTIAETTDICENLRADDHCNTFAAYLAANPSLGPEQRCIVLARAMRCGMRVTAVQDLWTQSSPTERMRVIHLLTPTHRSRFIVVLLKHCGQSARGEALAASVREQFGAGIDGDAFLSFAMDAAAMDFVHRDSCNEDPLDLVEAYLLETKGVPTIPDFVGPFLDRYAEAPPEEICVNHGNHESPQCRSALIRELRYRYNMALAKAWNVPPLRSALLLYAGNDPIRTVLGDFDADVTGKHIAASLRTIRPIHLLANGEHGQPDLDKLEGVRLGIVGKLLAAGWQRGAMPSVEQLRIALKEESSADRGLLPLVTTPTKHYPFHLLLNAHHRLAALATLVADEILPISVLHAIPLRQPRLSTTALLRKAFPAGEAVLLSWLDLLAFYPPAMKLLVRHDIG